MAADNNRRPGAGAAYFVAILLLVAVIVIVSVSLWRKDNSYTNALATDPLSTSPPTQQLAP